MATPGDFTVSGILYEGSDFSAWRTRVEAMLRLHHGLDASCELSHHCRIKSTNKRAAAKVQAVVSDRLLDRVPDECRDKPFCLIEALEARAKPFRLMELPPELRLRVYEEAIVETGEYHNVLRFSRFTPLVHSSSKLRQEALPIYYSLKLFTIELRVNQDSGLAGVYRFEKWMSEIAMSQRRAMRRLYVWVANDEYEDFWSLSLEFSEQTGLHIDDLEGPDDPPDGFRKKLKATLAATETYRKAMGWKGEALGLAVTAQPKLWEEAWPPNV